MRLRFMFIKTLSIALCAILVGCATLPPSVQDQKSSAVAISVFLNSLSFRIRSSKSSGEENVRIDYVFFIKLNNKDDSIMKREFILSNYVYESLKATLQFDSVDSFSMNVEPGIYAAVGAVGTGRTSGEKFIIYFPKEMVRATIREVNPNTITYMGKYLLDRATSLNIFDISRNQLTMGTTEKSDDNPQFFYSENHAFDLIKLEDGKTVITNYERPMVVLSSLSESFSTESDEKKFLTNHLKTFDGTEWIPKIKNRITMIDN